jgi:hypothetical protein
MATVVDKEKDDFVKELAINELERLKVDLNSFLLKYIKNDDDTESEETVKKLIQEQVKQEEK